ncbi:hypothetical protein DERF_015014 [Dermatophagoides farinae]|uniref:Uncharacterized protein n=1 Tax=Dermatophagoides farinae TaxID=6954 RepID=A0A922KVI6_DERFA|nr:hypothetical protein DERF_015014 [Dermatophagoides farinae]
MMMKKQSFASLKPMAKSSSSSTLLNTAKFLIDFDHAHRSTNSSLAVQSFTIKSVEYNTKTMLHDVTLSLNQNQRPSTMTDIGEQIKQYVNYILLQRRNDNHNDIDDRIMAINNNKFDSTKTSSLTMMNLDHNLT